MLPNNLSINLILGGPEEALDFEPIGLEFQAHPLPNVFGRLNNKTLLETVAQPRYKSLSAAVRNHYPDRMNDGIGAFLLRLKEQGDPLYLRSLNPYGDLAFCTFRLTDPRFFRRRGLYMYAMGDTVQYLGRCLDSFGKRVNQGYGSIHPKNCYRDGQATNCHLNALIAAHRDQVYFYACVLDDEAEITQMERLLIQRYEPPWNIQLKTQRTL